VAAHVLPATHSRFSPLGRTATDALVWAALFAYVVAAKLLLDAFLPGAFASPEQAGAFGWLPLTVVGSLGLIGAALSGRTGFPVAWDRRLPAVRVVVAPAVLGVVLGLINVVYDRATDASAVLNAAHGVTRQYTDFPSMFLIFTAAAVFVEPIYRLFLIPVPLWLISTVVLRGRWQAPVFWVLAVAASLFEPLDQTSAVADVAPWMLAFELTEGFALNMGQVVFFRRYGMVASVMVRLAYYLVWHVLYVH
jgi:hypothetical protein